LRATEFEFRLRFFIIVAIFTGGFWCYALDHVCVSVMLARWLTHHRIELSVASDRHAVQAVLAVGVVLAVLAAMVRTWAAAYLKSEVVHDWELHAEGLVADGPYRYVRNPLYLGGVLFGVGFALAASRLGFVIIVGGLTLFYYRLIAREEWLLSQTQGESYRQFLRAVPQLIPSFRPRVAAGSLAPRWGQAVFGETFMWFFAVAGACFAATLSQQLFVALTGTGVAASVLAKAVLRRRRRPHTPPPATP
jgi:protein-S-isoprenylcysteine O-methyltransferase Ste14